MPEIHAPMSPILIESPESMRQHARVYSASVPDGAVIALVGNLGAGKTHWTQGFVAGLGSDAVVTSPTFGLVHEYSDGRLPVFHFDFHRIGTADELLALGWDDYLDRQGIIIAEWADKFPELMPTSTHWIRIEALDDGRRRLFENI